MNNTLPAISLDLIHAAHEEYLRHLPPTCCFSYPMLNKHTGRTMVLKHENTQPTGAFKIRGGIALFALRGPNRLGDGVISASTGNHAQSIAYAAQIHNTGCTIVVPESTPAERIEGIELLGSRVIAHGADMAESIAYAKQTARRESLSFIAPTEPEIIAGHAGVYLELFAEHPDCDAVYVPIGSGSGAAGACLVRDGLGLSTVVIGVQSALAPAAHIAWSTGETATAPSRTRALGLATTSTCPRTQAIMRVGLHDFVLVDDHAIDQARALLATCAHTLAEGAGAAALAGARELGVGKKIGIIVSGGNATAHELATLPPDGGR